jgi:hypothetical protein
MQHYDSLSGWYIVFMVVNVIFTSCETRANVRHTKQPHNVKQHVNLTHDVLRYLRVQPRTNNDSLAAADAL